MGKKFDIGEVVLWWIFVRNGLRSRSRVCWVRSSGGMIGKNNSFDVWGYYCIYLY